MSTFYKLAYRVGFHPWEDLAGHPPFADTLSGLLARDEQRSARVDLISELKRRTH